MASCQTKASHSAMDWSNLNMDILCMISSFTLQTSIASHIRLVCKGWRYFPFTTISERMCDRILKRPIQGKDKQLQYVNQVIVNGKKKDVVSITRLFTTLSAIEYVHLKNMACESLSFLHLHRHTIHTLKLEEPLSVSFSHSTDFHALKCLEVIRLHESVLEQLLKSIPDSIERLTIDNEFLKGPETPLSNELLFIGSPNLKFLCLINMIRSSGIFTRLDLSKSIHLEKLSLHWNTFHIIEGTENMKSLRTVSLFDCGPLPMLPPTVVSVRYYKSLNVFNECSIIDSVVRFSTQLFPFLKHLELQITCYYINRRRNPDRKAMVHLDLSRYPLLETVRIICPHEDSDLEQTSVPTFEAITGIETLEHLQTLNIENTCCIKEIDISKLYQLKSIDIFGCHGLEILKGVDKAKQLEFLRIQCNHGNCKTVHIPNFSAYNGRSDVKYH